VVLYLLSQSQLSSPSQPIPSQHLHLPLNLLSQKHLLLRNSKVQRRSLVDICRKLDPFERVSRADLRGWSSLRLEGFKVVEEIEFARIEIGEGIGEGEG